MSQNTFKHLLQCVACEEHFYVLTRHEDQPGFCPLCGSQEVVDASNPVADEEEAEE